MAVLELVQWLMIGALALLLVSLRKLLCQVAVDLQEIADEVECADGGEGPQ